MLRHITIVAALLAGCAEDDETPRVGALLSGLQASGSALAKVTASGDGCPEGSWDAQVAGDGSGVSIALSDFAGVVGPGRLRDAKRCVLSLWMKDDGRVHMPRQITLNGRGGPVRYSVRAHWAGERDVATVEGGASGSLDSVMYAGNLRSSCSKGRELRVELEATAERSTRWPDEPVRAFYFDALRIDLDSDACAHVPPDDASDGVDARPPSPPELVVRSVQGSDDCAEGRARVKIAPTGDRFTVQTDLTVKGPARSRCTLETWVDVPPGKTLAAESLSFAGSASLANGESATISVVADQVAQAGAVSRQQLVVDGPSEGPLSLTATFPESQLFFRDCSRGPRPIRLVVNLRTSGSESADAQQSSGAALTQVGPVTFAVKDCPTQASAQTTATQSESE